MSVNISEDVVTLEGLFVGVNPEELVTLFEVPEDSWFVLTDFQAWTIHINLMDLVQDLQGVVTVKRSRRVLEKTGGYFSTTGIAFVPGSLVALRNSTKSTVTQDYLYSIAGYLVDAN